jgi:hypothetical protein
MRDFLKSSARWRQVSCVWPVVLMLALPGCFLDVSPYPPGSEAGEVFKPGLDPLNGAILCDIPKVPDPVVGECMEDDFNLDDALSLTQAATALVEGESRLIGLDYSKDARDACDGKPKKIVYTAPFPEGKTICLNCKQIPDVYLDAVTACVAKCIDLVNAGEHAAPGGAGEWCEQNVKVSTNFVEGCQVTGRCSNGGTPIEPFDDPRRQPEIAKWPAPLGFGKLFGNDLSKFVDPAKGEVDDDPTDWDAGGGADYQIITRGDAWIEFAAKERDKSHVLAVSTGNGADTDTSLNDVDFALSLNWDNSVYILEDDPTMPEGVKVNGPLETYEEGTRFRIRIKDNNDGTATLSATKITGACSTPTPETPGTKCPELEIGVQTNPGLSYPLRIHASFREDNATISNVQVVRIQEQP